MPISTIRLSVCLFAAGLVSSCGGGGSSRVPDASLVEKTYLGGIASYDKNRDNVVTCDEWKAAADRLFTRADQSDPGSLTKAEYKGLGSIDRTYVVLTFDYFDTDKDGKISKAEFVERPNPAFEVADKDKDCRLDEVELVDARTRATAPAEPKRQRPGIIRPQNTPSSGPGPVSTGGY